MVLELCNGPLYAKVYRCKGTRNDDYYLMRYGLDAILGRSWTIGVFHQYREDVSSDKSFSFKNNQAGVQATWTY